MGNVPVCLSSVETSAEPFRSVVPCTRCQGACEGGVFAFSWGKRAFCSRSHGVRSRPIGLLQGLPPEARTTLHWLEPETVQGVNQASLLELTDGCGRRSPQTILPARQLLDALGLLPWARESAIANRDHRTPTAYVVPWLAVPGRILQEPTAPERRVDPPLTLRTVPLRGTARSWTAAATRREASS